MVTRLLGQQLLRNCLRDLSKNSPSMLTLEKMFVNRTVKRKISKLPRAVLSNLRLPFFTFSSLVCSLLVIKMVIKTQSGYHKIDPDLLNLVSHNFYVKLSRYFLLIIVINRDVFWTLISFRKQFQSTHTMWMQGNFYG